MYILYYTNTYKLIYIIICMAKTTYNKTENWDKQISSGNQGGGVSSRRKIKSITLDPSLFSQIDLAIPNFSAFVEDQTRNYLAFLSNQDKKPQDLQAALNKISFLEGVLAGINKKQQPGEDRT
jgi:hypothetical protein